MQVFEESLDLADVPAGRAGDVRRRIALLLQVDDRALGLVLPVQQPLVDLVGLRELAGGGIVGGELNRAESSSPTERRRSLLTLRLRVWRRRYSSITFCSATCARNLISESIEGKLSWSMLAARLFITSLAKSVES